MADPFTIGETAQDFWVEENPGNHEEDRDAGLTSVGVNVAVGSVPTLAVKQVQPNDAMVEENGKREIAAKAVNAADAAGGLRDFEPAHSIDGVAQKYAGQDGAADEEGYPHNGLSMPILWPEERRGHGIASEGTDEVLAEGAGQG